MSHPWVRHLLVGSFFLSTPALAADHAEAPGAAADAVADLGDFYAWHTDAGRFVVVFTFSPVGATTSAPVVDADVLYGIHIDRDADQIPDADLWVRFGEDADGNWGVQLEGAPGSSGAISGAVGTTIEQDGIKVWAGTSDDPFFFDLAGFQDTLATASIAFTGTDGLAGLNTTTVVVELDSSAVADGATRLDLWATTGRK